MDRNRVRVVFDVILDAARNQRATLHIEVRATERPISGAEIVAAGVTYRKDANGKITIPVDAASIDITIVKQGLAPVTTSVEIPLGGEQTPQALGWPAGRCVYANSKSETEPESSA